MSIRTTRLLAAALAVTLAGCASGRYLSAPPGGMSLAGGWQLNEEASARPDSSRAVGDRRPRTGGDSIPGAIPGGGRGGRSLRGARPMAGFGAMQPPERFTIEQTGTAVTFRFAPKRAVTLRTDGSPTKTRFWPGVAEVDLRARWTEAGLRVERKLPMGGSLVETYSRDPGAQRLVVTTEFSGRRAPSVQIRRVYDAVDGS